MIHKKSRHEISLMNRAGSIVAEVLNEIKIQAKVGMSTAQLDAIAEQIITKNGAFPTFKGYHGFPAAICSSVNNEVVHGIPSNSIVLNEGDIISIDVGATYKGLVADSAITIGIGQVSEEVEQLMEVTNLALMKAIEHIAPDVQLRDVSGVIEDVAKEHGYGLVKQYGGHGLGKNLHEDPFVFNYRTSDAGPVLKSGMVIAIEPMFNLGTGDVFTLPDNWTVVTKDGKPSAHFEHTVAVTEDGYKILTLLD